MSFPTLPGSNVQITPGRGGDVSFEPHLYVSTWDNQIRFDIMPYIIDGEITHDISRASGTWALDATISIDGWGLLRPFVDWLSPVLTVHYADGSSQTRQLGHYLLLDGSEERAEIGGTVRIDARDVLWVLSVQGIPDIVIAPASATPIPPTDPKKHPKDPPVAPPIASLMNWGALIEQVIAESFVPGGPTGSHLRENISGAAINAWVGPDGPIFDIGKPRLEVCNELLAGASWFPLHVSETGVIGTVPLQSVYFTTPIRRWLANPPDGPFMLGKQLADPSPRERASSPIAETIQSTPSTADIIDTVVVTGGVVTPVTSTSTIDGYFTSVGRGSDLRPVVTGSVRTVHAPTVTNEIAAQSLADAILEQALTENTSLTINVEPDPSFVSIHNTVTLGIWDAHGRQIANGIYAVNRVKYGLMPENPLMQIDVAAFDAFIPSTPSSPQT